MIIHAETKQIAVTEEDLWNGFPCPVCGKFYVPNGTGPTNKALIAKILKGMPSEAIVGGVPARFHDTAYLLCPAGWTVHLGTHQAASKKQADRQYFRLMMDQHKDSSGLASFLVWIMAKRNYGFVCVFGRSSFKHDH